MRNEFESDASIKGKPWRFKNINPEEFVWHQKRKLIYGVFHDKASKRTIKVEFEPVKDWSEIRNEYNEIRSIALCGWVKAFLRVEDNRDAPFMPLIYNVKTLKIVDGPKVEDIRRVKLFMSRETLKVLKLSTGIFIR